MNDKCEWIITSFNVRRKSNDLESILSFVSKSKQTWTLTRLDGRSFQWNGAKVMSVEIC